MRTNRSKPRKDRKRPVKVNRSQSLSFDRQTTVYVMPEDMPFIRRIARFGVDKVPVDTK